MLLKSWATPPASWPTTSIFCDCRSCSSSCTPRGDVLDGRDDQLLVPQRDVDGGDEAPCSRRQFKRNRVPAHAVGVTRAESGHDGFPRAGPFGGVAEHQAEEVVHRVKRAPGHAVDFLETGADVARLAGAGGGRPRIHWEHSPAPFRQTRVWSRNSRSAVTFSVMSRAKKKITSRSARAR
jgi:hypothetical protein